MIYQEQNYVSYNNDPNKERAKNVVEKKSVDILPQGSDGEFILSEDDLDDSDSGDSFEVVQTATSPPKCTIAAKFPLAPFPRKGV